MLEYRFFFGDDDPYTFQVDENTDTGDESGHTDFPDWMRLENHQCAHCRIETGSRVACPAALSVEPILQVLAQRLSYENIRVEVERPEFTIEATTTAQRGTRSLMGLLMALSTCPTMMKLRPMARNHLPFASPGQTVFRALGMYFIGQYLRLQEGLSAEWDLAGLQAIYREVHEVNVMVANRMREACEMDAAVNSLILLDTHVTQIETSIEQNLAKLKPAFSIYLED